MASLNLSWVGFAFHGYSSLSWLWQGSVMKQSKFFYIKSLLLCWSTVQVAHRLNTVRRIWQAFSLAPEMRLWRDRCSAETSTPPGTRFNLSTSGSLRWACSLGLLWMIFQWDRRDGFFLPALLHKLTSSVFSVEEIEITKTEAKTILILSEITEFM